MTSSHITPQEILKTAQLARLRLTESEIKVFTKQLEAVFSYLESLKDVPTNSITPMQSQNSQNDFRSDTVQPGLEKAEVLSSASSDGNYILAPQTIHKE